MDGIGSGGGGGRDAPVFLITFVRFQRRRATGSCVGCRLLSWILLCEPYVFGGNVRVQWTLRKGHGRVTP